MRRADGYGAALHQFGRGAGKLAQQQAAQAVCDKMAGRKLFAAQKIRQRGSMFGKRRTRAGIAEIMRRKAVRGQPRAEPFHHGGRGVQAVDK